MSNQITYRVEDSRVHQGVFDVWRLDSIGMAKHVVSYTEKTRAEFVARTLGTLTSHEYDPGVR